jgi:hypothetical protein
MKRIFILALLLSVICSSAGLYAIDGFFLGYKGGFFLKIDVASAFVSKRIIDPEKHMDNSIPTGIGQFGVADSHGFPRVLESKVAPYGDMIFGWGYKFPKVFTLGFGILLSNLVMPSLMFDFKFSFRENLKIRPYVFASFYGGLFDGFPVGLTAGGGIDFFLNDHFFLLVETKLGAEIFVSRYYDDGINSNPIWHWDSTYAYGVYGIYIGLGYQFKNPYTDENGKWIGRKKSE